ncbi:precorrin-6A/cobalt-precorrin-6A reductase, partial [Micromonospora chalcea]
MLGGTGEARALAASLVDDGAVVVTSLAGRVARPRLPVGQVRVGGFGGIAGLAAYLAETRVRAVVDATHPFAEKISANAAGLVTRVDDEFGEVAGASANGFIGADRGAPA